jgi:hypothetical protein
MRWWLLAALQVAPMVALPLAHHSDWKGKQHDPKVEVLDFGPFIPRSLWISR